ncbi:MAG: hypothetical protein MZV70_39880 [Desulfobacterales bacterium]|nr:hypothetical protein [Desulfobacterales bacterium]
MLTIEGLARDGTRVRSRPGSPNRCRSAATARRGQLHGGRGAAGRQAAGRPTPTSTPP